MRSRPAEAFIAGTLIIPSLGLSAIPAVHAQTTAPVVADAASGSGVLELYAGGQVTALSGTTAYSFSGAGHLASPAVAITAAPGGGYYIATRAGNVYAIGGAKWFGSPWQQAGGRPTPSPVVSISANPSGGYVLLTAAGNVFNYGTPWHGSPAGKVGTSATSISVAKGGGYVVLTASGGVVNYAMPWSGSLSAAHVSFAGSANSIATVAGTDQYYVSTTSGHVYNFGGAPWMGSPAAAGTASAAAVGIVPLSGGGYMVGLRFGQLQGFTPQGRSTVGNPTPPPQTSTPPQSTTGNQAAALGFYPGDGPNPASYFQSEAAWLGQKPKFVESFLAYNSGSAMAGSAGWVASQYGTIPWHPTLIISVPLGFQGQSPSANFNAITSGSYDAAYRQSAQALAKYPANVIVRLGWEFDGNWFPWSAQTDPSGFAAAYRHVVNIFRSVSPTKFTYSLVGTAGNGKYWPAAWPGNGYVNSFGIDAYDEFLPVADTKPYSGTWVNQPKAWSYLLSDLNLAENFAKSHGVQMAVGEWGVVQFSHQTPNSMGGDNPTYIQGMANWANSLPASGPGSLSYMSYFNNANTQANFKITDPAVPNAAAAFKKVF